MTVARPEAGRLTVRYLPSGHVEIGCTLTGDTALVSAADINRMLTQVPPVLNLLRIGAAAAHNPAAGDGRPPLRRR